MNIDLYFPTPVWWEHTEIKTEDMVALCYRLREQDPVGRKLSNQGGWQSRDFRAGTYPEMKQLEDRILEQAEQCVRDFGYREDLCFVDIENFWFNINHKNHTNAVHTHDNSFISGVFYLKARHGHGNINFYKSYGQDFIVASQATIGQFTSLSASAMSFVPESQKLIMFPGWLPHGVERNELDEDRISISFNVKIIRTDDDRYRPTHTKRN
jgi:uncharacterized protein (TIGR02466 family)